ncbi:hypothetical protein B0181_05525 [Moraxella caviae]|uniref:Glutathione import ATP-binding protein GsiA n=1 Tax=Moraxella caviae TaxID=34060 RepID=A0A1T0A2Y9_9GAMM|nr:ATP-binding cassette domain-containing protein [Moraxella caviae]OOR90103.1 hypothetical protein B0181_05525 [Moraxella caviae]STZ14726.1 Glutathione import ATP-binding protein GsiA [Moraxella caviae]VEW14036.1 Glutathione import ATP-binding protein GsiA [Moraxella caviae]
MSDKIAAAANSPMQVNVNPAKNILLQVQNLTITTPSTAYSQDTPSKICRVQDVSFTIGCGEIVAWVGASGVGKTLAAHALLGLADGAKVSGVATFHLHQANQEQNQNLEKIDNKNTNFTDGNLEKLHKKSFNLPLNCPNDDAWQAVRGTLIGYIAQEPHATLNPVHTVRTAFAKLFARLNLPKKHYHAKAISLLAQVGLNTPDEYLPRLPHQLSGGEAQRIAIALTLALDPVLIIADEPTSNLDDDKRDEILELLQSLAKQGRSILLITHDVAAAKISDRVLAWRAHPQGSTLSAQLPSDTGLMELSRMAQDLPANHHNKPQTTPMLSVRNLRIRHQQGFWQKEWKDFWGIGRQNWQRYFKQQCTLFGRFFHQNSDDKSSKNVLQSQSQNQAQIQPQDKQGISFEIMRGEMVGLMGASGAGKTSLAKVIARLSGAQVSGEILVDGVSVLPLAGKALRAHYPSVQYISQNVGASFNPRRTIFESLTEGLQANKRAIDREQISELLALVQLDESVLPRLPHTFSGGEKQRLAIVRALLMQPKLLILDEPTSMLDTDTTIVLLKLLYQINTRFGTTMLVISHDKAVLQAVCGRVVRLNDFKVFGD